MILTGEKLLLSKSQVKPVDVGHYPELSVKAMYEDFAKRPEVAPYLPPKLHKGRQCDKEYFWNVVNTLFEEEVTAIVTHANKQRNFVDQNDLQKESISMTQDWVDMMNLHPWSSVSTILLLI